MSKVSASELPVAGPAATATDAGSAWAPGDARDVPVASGGAGFIPFAAAVVPTDTVQTSAATPLQADWTLPLAVVLLAIAGLAVLFRRLLN